MGCMRKLQMTETSTPLKLLCCCCQLEFKLCQVRSTVANCMAMLPLHSLPCTRPSELQAAVVRTWQTCIVAAEVRCCHLAVGVLGHTTCLCALVVLPGRQNDLQVDNTNMLGWRVQSYNAM